MLKPYMAYSRLYGFQEGAILVIAHTAKEARKLAWGHCFNVDEWIDQTATLIDQNVLILADQEMVNVGQSHIIEYPEYCTDCQLWGCGLTEDNLCANCNQFPGDKLIERYKRQAI
jgi:hypothetical protein